MMTVASRRHHFCTRWTTSYYKPLIIGLLSACRSDAVNGRRDDGSMDHGCDVQSTSIDFIIAAEYIHNLIVHLIVSTAAATHYWLCLFHHPYRHKTHKDVDLCRPIQYTKTERSLLLPTRRIFCCRLIYFQNKLNKKNKIIMFAM